jgi:hypothetical protein
VSSHIEAKCPKVFATTIKPTYQIHGRISKYTQMASGVVVGLQSTFFRCRRFVRRHPRTALRHAARVERTIGLVKVFGCRQAYENRPCTNPRGCGVGLWGFRVLLGRGDGEIGVARALVGACWVKFFARRTVDRALATADIQSCRADLGEGRAGGHSPRLGCCGVR